MATIAKWTETTNIIKHYLSISWILIILLSRHVWGEVASKNNKSFYQADQTNKQLNLTTTKTGRTKSQAYKKAPANKRAEKRKHLK